MEDAGGEEGAEGIGDNVPAVEDRGAQPEFAALVPFADEEKRPWEEGGLDEAEEKPGQKGTDEAVVWGLGSTQHIDAEISLFRDTCRREFR